MASSSSILLATSAPPTANLIMNKSPLLHPMRSSPLSVPTIATSSSSSRSSSKINNVSAAATSAQMMLMMISCFDDDDDDEDEEENGDDNQNNPLVSLSRLPGPDSSPNQILSGADDDVDVEKKDWVVTQDDEAVYVKVYMAGLGKEDAKISIVGNTLIMEGKEKKEQEGNDDKEGNEEDELVEKVRVYSGKMDLNPNLLKLDQVKAEMKNGVLRVCLPKVKEEERSDIFTVEVE